MADMHVAVCLAQMSDVVAAYKAERARIAAVSSVRLATADSRLANELDLLSCNYSADVFDTALVKVRIDVVCEGSVVGVDIMLTYWARWHC